MSQEDLRGSTPEFDYVKFQEAMRLQNPQLQLLRELGVAQMIEQNAGIEIPPLVFEDPVTPLTLERTLALGVSNGGGWTLISIPRSIGKDVYDTTLRIEAFRIINNSMKEGSRSACTRDSQSVSIEFSQNKHLKVVGNETTFEGDLTAVNDELLTRVQIGIEEAFTNPKIASSTTEFSPMSAVTLGLLSRRAR